MPDAGYLSEFLKEHSEVGILRSPFKEKATQTLRSDVTLVPSHTPNNSKKRKPGEVCWRQARGSLHMYPQHVPRESPFRCAWSRMNSIFNEVEAYPKLLEHCQRMYKLTVLTNILFNLNVSVMYCLLRRLSGSRVGWPIITFSFLFHSSRSIQGLTSLPQIATKISSNRFPSFSIGLLSSRVNRRENSLRSQLPSSCPSWEMTPPCFQCGWLPIARGIKPLWSHEVINYLCANPAVSI